MLQFPLIKSTCIRIKMSLKDITNITDVSCATKGVTKRKRLSDGSFKQYHYAKIRKNFELAFSNDSEKLQFETKLELFKKKNGLISVKDASENCVSKKESNFSDLLGNAKHGNFICENNQILELVQKVSQHQKKCHRPCTIIYKSFWSCC